MYKHTLVVTGKHQDLDAICRRLSLPPEHGEIKKYADPADARLTDTTVKRLGNPQDGGVRVGTTRLEIGFNGDIEKLKRDILVRFPDVAVSP